MKLTILALFLLSFILVDTVKANYMQEYCDNREYFTMVNYPHLHCDSDFLTLSYKRQGEVKHADFADGDEIFCPRVIRALNDPVRYGSFHTNQQLRDAIMDFATSECQEGMKFFKKDYYNKLIKNHESSKKKPKTRMKMSNKDKMKKKLMKHKKQHKTPKNKNTKKNKIRDGF